MSYLDAFARVLPVILLFLLGAVIRHTAFLPPATIIDLRRIVLTIALPSALFLTFLRVTLKADYLVIVVAVFAACLVMLAAGSLLGRAVGLRSPYTAPLLTGFEAGMLGYAIYGAVFGADNLYRFGVVDLGQVAFVFFVLATVLQRRASGRAPGLAATVAAFLRTPVIIAIAAGVALNMAGAQAMLDGDPVGGAALRTLEMVAALTTPLIAIVIGYQTRLRRGALGAPARTVALWMGAWVLLALAFNALVIDGILHLDRLWQAAILTMAILPPPFVIPLFMRDGAEASADRDYVVNTLSLATVATVVAFSIVGVAFAV